MTEQVPYSLPSDLLVGNIPLPAYVDQTKLVQDAADEIDSHIGFIYSTPVDMSEAGPVSRPARLLLKRISVHISSGRAIMAMASAQEDQETHRYGLYLLAQGLEALASIETGKVLLDGALPADPDGLPAASTPLLYNVDEVSNVEAFYGKAYRTARTS